MLEDAPGALWTHGNLEATRVREPPAEFSRIVVAIDPAATSGEEADETGILVVGKDSKDHGYVLADLSGRYQPIEWAKIAINAYRNFGADRVVAEINNGGEMVEATIRMVDPNVSYTPVRASRGKVTRAEPVSALYEQGRIHHVGVFSELEQQMAEFTSDFDREVAGYSPDRVDALVWACTNLFVIGMAGEGLFNFYRQSAVKLAEVKKEATIEEIRDQLIAKGLVSG